MLFGFICLIEAMALAYAVVRPAYLIRLISADDDVTVAALICSVMPEFGERGPGSPLHDAEVATMSAAYRAPRSAYFVVEDAGEVVGGAGVAPLAGGQFEVCELRKMYFLRAARGHGMGAVLLRHCMRVARGFGYQVCYLETLTGMDAARHLYERAGFRPLCQPLGANAHFACDRWFALELSSAHGRICRPWRAANALERGGSDGSVLARPGETRARRLRSRARRHLRRDSHPVCPRSNGAYAHLEQSGRAYGHPSRHGRTPRFSPGNAWAM